MSLEAKNLVRFLRKVEMKFNSFIYLSTGARDDRASTNIGLQYFNRWRNIESV